MHTRSIENWRHDHVFLGAHHSQRERRVWLVVALTAVMMVVEIAGGMIYGSMALVADGFHQHIPREYIYFAIAFSIGVESLNLVARSRRARRRTVSRRHDDR